MVQDSIIDHTTSFLIMNPIPPSMHSLLKISLFALCLISCKPEQSNELTYNNTRTIITGNVKDFRSYPATRFLSQGGHRMCNAFQFPEYLIDESGNFKIELFLEEAKVFILKPFNGFYIYVTPGDSIYI